MSLRTARNRRTIKITQPTKITQTAKITQLRDLRARIPFFCALLFCMLLFCTLLSGGRLSFLNPLTAYAAEPEELTILFIHDTHDYLYPTESMSGTELREHGGAAKLVTLLKENSDENTLILDGGDFSMGTLYQAAYSTDAPELRNLGLSGVAATCFGNHEFDYGASGAASMLRAAVASGDPLPQILASNFDFSGALTAEQQEFQEALQEAGVKENTILTCAGYKIGLFAVMGYDCIECTQAELAFTDYIEASKLQVEKLRQEGCDLIIALSHSGTDGNGETGEDFDLAAAVPGIDLILSAHSHSCYETPVQAGSALILSCGEYLQYVGKLKLVKKDGSLQVTDFALLPIDSSVPEDPETLARLQGYQKKIEETYLADKGGSFDRAVAHSSFATSSLTEMYGSHGEYTTGDLIADSYLYEAEQNGITDIDVALVGLGTIRASVLPGEITVADVFEICSLGVGADGSAGHPIVGAWITGKELKLLTELDASLGASVNSIKMSYSGLSYTFNTKRLLLDRVTEVCLVRKDGTREEIEDARLYKVAANMYAVNMLGMLNGLTKGLLSITPKDAEGNPIEDFYQASLKTAEGTEIKEWVALLHYLESFEAGETGLPELPLRYSAPQGRKNKVSEGGLAVLAHPGTATKVMPAAVGTLVLVLALITAAVVLAVKRRRRRKAARNGIGK